MKIAICDDEDIQLELLKKMVSDWAFEKQEEIRFYTYHSAEQLLFAWEEQLGIDVLLLDIQMSGMNGMELARKLRKKREEVPIIFITGIKDYVFEGYSVDAISYILKPIQKEQFEQALEKAAARREKEEEYLFIKDAGSIEKIRVKDIIYIESIGHDSYIYTADGIKRNQIGIHELEQRLNEKRQLFVKNHRSYLVSISKIASINKREMIMEDGTRLPIARGKWEQVNLAYLEYYRGK